jgi:hypothetical protein
LTGGIKPGIKTNCLTANQWSQQLISLPKPNVRLTWIKRDHIPIVTTDDDTSMKKNRIRTSYRSRQITLQHPSTPRVPQSAQGSTLNLPDTLAGEAKLLAHFFQGVRLSIMKSKTKTEYASLTR